MYLAVLFIVHTYMPSLCYPVPYWHVRIALPCSLLTHFVSFPCSRRCWPGFVERPVSSSSVDRVSMNSLRVPTGRLILRVPTCTVLQTFICSVFAFRFRFKIVYKPFLFRYKSVWKSFRNRLQTVKILFRLSGLKAFFA
jgi:hypothetical protein